MDLRIKSVNAGVAIGETLVDIQIVCSMPLHPLVIMEWRVQCVEVIICMAVIKIAIKWNLSITDTWGTKNILLYRSFHYLGVVLCALLCICAHTSSAIERFCYRSWRILLS
jgi:hypothetical protein